MNLRALPTLLLVLAACCGALHAGATAAAVAAHDPKASASGAVAHEAHVSRHRPQFGVASVYARMLDGRKTAGGETHDSDDLTAAHRTLPLGTTARVTNLSNGRATVVRINDRGPQLVSRIIDLSPRAAAAIGLRAGGKGLTRVRIDVVAVPPAPEADARRTGGAAQRAPAADADTARAEGSLRTN